VYLVAFKRQGSHDLDPEVGATYGVGTSNIHTLRSLLDTTRVDAGSGNNKITGSSRICRYMV